MVGHRWRCWLVIALFLPESLYFRAARGDANGQPLYLRVLAKIVQPPHFALGISRLNPQWSGLAS